MWMEEVKAKKKRGNRVLFTRDSVILQDLRMLLEGRNRRTVILWALELAQETVEELEAGYPGDSRPRNALNAARAWAAGEIKMPGARQAILDCHAMAGDLTDPAAIARCHAVGQACSVVHTSGHALGYPMYELTAIVLEKGEDAGAAVEKREKEYVERLLLWIEQEPVYPGKWAGFLRNNPSRKTICP